MVAFLVKLAKFLFLVKNSLFVRIGKDAVTFGRPNIIQYNRKILVTVRTYVKMYVTINAKSIVHAIALLIEIIK